MATTNIKNYNVTPYYDDFDESKGFHRILFKPGVSVQARELTQLQTLLQAQIGRRTYRKTHHRRSPCFPTRRSHHRCQPHRH